MIRRTIGSWSTSSSDGSQLPQYDILTACHPSHDAEATTMRRFRDSLFQL
jgi:hypothetical protein